MKSTSKECIEGCIVGFGLTTALITAAGVVIFIVISPTISLIWRYL